MAMGRAYSLTIGAEASGTSAKTLIEIAAPADAVVFVERWWMANTSQDSAEQLAAKVQRISITGTGTASTARPFESGDAAFGGTCKTNMTIEPTYDANGVLLEKGWNTFTGHEWTPESEDVIHVVSPSALIGYALDVPPGTSLNLSYGCHLREIGG